MVYTYTVSHKAGDTGNAAMTQVTIDLEKDDLCNELHAAARGLGCPSGGSYVVKRDGWVNGGARVTLPL